MRSPTSPAAWDAGRQAGRPELRRPAAVRQPGLRDRLRDVVLRRAGLRRLPGARRATARPTPTRPPSCRLDRRYDHLVAITRSGTTSEVLNLVAAAGARTPVPVTAITAAGGSPVTGLRAAVDRAGLRRRASRSCRRASRPPCSRCSGPTSARTSRRSPRRPGWRSRPSFRWIPAKFEHFVFVGTGAGAAAGQRGGAEDARDRRRLDRGLPGDGAAARPDERAEPAVAGLVARRRARAAWATRSPAPARRGSSQPEDPQVALVRVQRLAVGERAGQGAGPRPSPFPVPVGHPARPRLTTREVMRSDQTATGAETAAAARGQRPPSPRAC